MQCKHHFYLKIHVTWIEPDIVLTLRRSVHHSRGSRVTGLLKPNSGRWCLHCIIIVAHATAMVSSLKANQKVTSILIHSQNV